MEMIGIGVRFAGKHAARDHTLYFRIGMHHLFQFKAEHGEHVAQLFRRSRIRDKFLQPIETQQHIYFSSEDERQALRLHGGPGTRRGKPDGLPGRPFLYAGN